ncbi:MAG: segregation/condensation protein A [Candidatus Omnitrophota bacterium]|nr:segregation/condensation protein A [Candidatus Omnitrophota bacterium]
MSYKLKLDIFEGPLDLLLYLIKKDEINIYDIPIAKVTEQYLQYLELMKLLDLEIVGEFLVMAATLMQIKSKMLLPPDPSEVQEEEEIDPREDLVKRLLEYQKFKAVAQELRNKEMFRQDGFTRIVANPQQKPETPDEVYFEASLFDLISAFTKALKEVPKELFYEVIKDEFTVESKIHDILHQLLVFPELKLSALFESCKNKLEIVAAFLAILELIRIKEIIILQKNIFGEIEIFRNKENISPYAKRTPKTHHHTGD